MLLHKNKIVFTIAVLVAATTIVYCTSGETSERPAPINNQQAELEVSVEKGHRLVIGGACHDCHSPKIMTPIGPQVDSSKMLSGHPETASYPKVKLDALQPGNWILFAPDLTTFVGPWGMSFAANLTSDSATGIGAWSEANFVDAIRKGKHMGMDNARPIMPPMPWENYNNLSDSDLKSIFAYLQTTVPITNRVHAPYSPDEVRAMTK
jgi:mono/diheme cytochrome c family protein